MASAKLKVLNRETSVITIGIDDTNSQLSRLVDQAAAGESVVIERAGKPVAMLVPFVPASQPRKPGNWRGRVRIAEDFDDLPEELEIDFYGDAK